MLLSFLLSNWRLVAFAATIAVLSATAGYYKWQANRWEGKYEAFVVEVRAAGIAAQAQAKAKEEADKKAKKVADEKYRTDVSNLRVTLARLRDEHSRSDLLPPAAPGSRDPSTACFDRPQLVGALRRFEEGIEAIAGEGDEARQALDSAKAWAQTPR